MAATYDIIVIGGGVNGLTVAAYLAKAGAKVAVFERRHEVGTHCCTEELMIPGLVQNLCATSMLSWMSPCIADLELEKYGYELIPAKWGFMHVFKDKKAFLTHPWDANITYKKLSRISKEDASTLKKLVNYFAPLRSRLLDFLYSPPSNQILDELVSLASKAPGIPEDWTKLNGFKLLELLFEDEHIRTSLAGQECSTGFCPWYDFVGPLGIILFVGARGIAPTFYTRGGSHMLPHALSRCIIDNGGMIFRSCEVEKIIIEDGEAKGIKLSKYSAYPEHEVMADKAVVSDLTVKPTFLELVGEEHLDHEIVKHIKAYNYDGQILFTAAYITKELPKWISAEYDRDVLDSWRFNYGAECLDDIKRMAKDLKEGVIPDPIVSVGGSFIYTMLDPSPFHPNLHSLHTWIDVPFNLKDGGAEKWDEIKYEFLEKITDRVDEYAPNFRKSIIASSAWSPLDVYRRNPSAVHGTWSGGPIHLGQFYMDRPFPGCGAPRTPIKKLYICNSSWPHGATWLASGYVCATVLAEDLKIRKQPWWTHKPGEWLEHWATRKGIEIKPTITIG